MSEPRKRSRSANIFFPFAPSRKLTGRRRALDRMLKRLGPSWRSSPVRRGVQVLCLGLFLYLFLYVAWPYSRTFSGTLISGKEHVPLETFLWIDPLVGLSTAVAARAWNVALWGMLAIFLVGLFFPRGFCGYLCPLGTLIDTFDWLIGKHVRRFRVGLHKGLDEAPAGDVAQDATRRPGRAPGEPPRPALRPRRASDKVPTAGWWATLRYYVLAAVLAGSACGVLLSGYVSAIPVLTRGLHFTLGQLELGLLKNWGQVKTPDAAFIVSVILFLGVFLLGLLGPRFWCRYVCPSGALLSLFNFLRVGERKVEASCIKCDKCREVCPFDAIKEDFTTRVLECTFCQTCGGVCPTQSIKFVSRWNDDGLKEENDIPVLPRSLSRRAFLVSAAGGAAGALASGPALGGVIGGKAKLLRPPGSAPEAQFLDLCIRCGECFKVCPGPVLHPAGLQSGLEALWTPVAVPEHAGCHQECNFCTQVCPTGAIRPLTLGQKRRTHMGLAKIDTALCLPHRGERDCQLCFDECEAAGYHAIEMREIKLEVGEVPEGLFSPDQMEQMGHITAPFISAEACVGCGLCEYRCHTALVKQRKLLPRSAVVTVAENEDRV